MVEILYVDNHLLVLNKPAGMLTQPNESEGPSLEVWGKAWLKQSFEKPGNVFLHAVHRLDRPVSGIVLFARTSKALSRLNSALRAHHFEKEYLALVEGTFQEKEGVYEHYLEKDSFRSRVVAQEGCEAKKALLKYRVLKSSPEYALLRVSLITGRYHQIRAQLAAECHPVIGDRKYGATQDSSHLFLHHASLSFPHPVTQKRVQVEAPLPEFWTILKF